MNDNRYKKAMEQVTFDQHLDQKIMDYVISHGEGINKKNTKRARSIRTAAVAACMVCLVTGAVFAAAVHFRNVTPVEHGLVAKDSSEVLKDTNKSGNTSNTKDTVFSDTGEIRSLMAEDSTEYQLLKEEKGTRKTNWIQKMKWHRNSSSYYSEDGVQWQKDESIGTEILDEYIYASYTKGAKDAALPDVMKNLNSQVKLDGNVSFGEYSNLLYGEHVERNDAVNSRQLKAVFSYKKGKVLTDLSQDMTMKAGEKGSFGVITGTEPTVNHRTYHGANSMTYELSDSTVDGTLKTTTLVSSGPYQLILQFENLSEQAIHEVLDQLDLSGLESDQ